MQQQQLQLESQRSAAFWAERMREIDAIDPAKNEVRTGFKHLLGPASFPRTLMNLATSDGLERPRVAARPHQEDNEE